MSPRGNAVRRSPRLRVGLETFCVCGARIVREAGELMLTAGRARSRASPAEHSVKILVSGGGELSGNARACGRFASCRRRVFVLSRSRRTRCFASSPRGYPKFVRFADGNALHFCLRQNINAETRTSLPPRIFAFGKNIRKLLSREAGINRREAPTQLLNASTFFPSLRERKGDSPHEFRELHSLCCGVIFATRSAWNVRRRLAREFSFREGRESRVPQCLANTCRFSPISTKSDCPRIRQKAD